MVTGRQIGGYQILEELGRGAMGVVFKARQLSMDRIVAIKFLPKKLAQDERIVQRFLREARAAGQLSHPNIVSVHELGMADGLHFIAMEYVDGNSIQKKLKDKGCFTERETLDISLQIAEALKLAHSKGILHRDIKPDNFLIDSAGRVRLADLGLALIQSNTDGGLTQDGTTLGTPHFMSPEQCSGVNIDARSDLYSLGSSMFVMSTLRTPYDGSTAAAVMVKVLTEPPQSIKKIRPDLSNGFVSIVEKLMHKDPAKRYQDAQSVVDALHQCINGNLKVASHVSGRSPFAGKGTGTKPHNVTGQHAPVGAEKPGTRLQKPQTSRLMPLLTGALAAVILLGMFFYLSRGKTQATPIAHATVQAAPTVPGVTSEKASLADAHTPTIGLKTADEPHAGTAEPERERHPIQMSQLRDMAADFDKGKVKPIEALRRLTDFRRENEKRLLVADRLRKLATRLETDIQAKLKSVADDWRKLDAKVDADVQDGNIADALIKLSAFEADNQGAPEAAKAAERVEALCSGVLTNAERIAGTGNFKDARAQLALASKVNLPEKQDAAFKAASAIIDEHAKLHQELTDCYDRAVQKALYYDPVPRTRFQFLDGAKYCADFAAKTHSDSLKKDALDMADLFKQADRTFAAVRAEVTAHQVLLPTLAKYTNVRITQWDEHGLTFIPDSFKQPQPFSWETHEAPDTVLLVARESKKADLDKSAAQWELGVLAFALGNQPAAGKWIRDAISKEESSPKPQAATALRVLKAPDASAKSDPSARSEKSDKSETAVASASLEDEARLLFKDLLAAKKADSKEKIKAIRADLDGKFAATEFVKAHKKEIDDLSSVTSVAAMELDKAAEAPKPEKPKDTLAPEEKEARDLLKQWGWTEIIGTFVWDKVNNCIRVDGVAEVVNPARDSDVSVRFRLLDSTSRIRVLARVDKTAVGDRFANFGGKTSLGFGADVNQERAFVYMDYKSKLGTSKDPVQYAEIKMENRPYQSVDVNFHDKKLSVYVNSTEKKSSGDARTSGDTRVIVSGPILLASVKISNTK